MIKIGDRKISKDNPPFIIAEMSGNHNQSLDRALEIVDSAAKAGVDAIKIQTYTADTMTLAVDTQDFLISDPNSPWYGKNLHDLYQEAYTPWEWHRKIFERAEALGLIAFSTPFDSTAVDFLESLNVPCYKIASFENSDIPLIRKVAATGKPMIISTGVSTIAELHETYQAARKARCKELILLKCTSSYPAPPENSNLLTIPHMNQLFKCPVGLSDHTLGIGVSIAAVALGAVVIEKHFTLDRNDGGVDAAFSLEPAEMAGLVKESKQAWKALGTVQYEPTEKEIKSKKYKRSIYAIQDIKAGDTLNEKNIKVIRPGFGLPPKYYDILIGRSVYHDIKKGTPISWDLFN